MKMHVTYLSFPLLCFIELAKAHHSSLPTPTWPMLIPRPNPPKATKLGVIAASLACPSHSLRRSLNTKFYSATAPFVTARAISLFVRVEMRSGCSRLTSACFRSRIDPNYENVTWHHGSETRVGRYQFNTKTRDHMFCPRCGASIGIDFWNADPKRYGISVSGFGEGLVIMAEHWLI
jgi:hypothetical protein